ncbi:MAG TPA: hypothetical protein VIY48_15910 [Candidatus Paceibacterota bacterium]
MDDAFETVDCDQDYVALPEGWAPMGSGTIRITTSTSGIGTTYLYGMQQTDSERCEMCGTPITKGKMPQGSYPVVFIQCHKRLKKHNKWVNCNHMNRFPR